MDLGVVWTTIGKTISGGRRAIVSMEPGIRCYDTGTMDGGLTSSA